MTTWMNRSCRLAVWIVSASCAWMPVSVSAAPSDLFLEVTLNGATMPQLARFTQKDGRLYARREDLKALGVQWPTAVGDASGAGAQIDIARATGVRVDFDARSQHLQLTVPPAMLDRPLEHLDASHRSLSMQAAPAVPSLLVNYELYAQQTRSTASASSLNGWTEWRLGGVGSGVFSQTVSSHWSSASATQGSALRNVRLDTTWQRDLPDTLTTLTVGDLTTKGLSWTRSTRLGGLRLSRNFGLDPYGSTAPLASVRGEAVLPSVVDLYINGVRQSQRQVAPGLFQIDDLPFLNGAGHAQMTITDITGQRRVVELPLYGTPDLLRSGLADWSVELGSVRRNYGLDDFGYVGGPVASGSWRYGLSDALTVDTHGEADAHVQMSGAGVTWRIGTQGGVANASLASSHSDAGIGLQAALGYQWNDRYWRFGGRLARSDPAFADVASRHGAAVNRASDQLYAGVTTALGQFGLSMVQQRTDGQALTRALGLDWSKQLQGGSTLSLGFFRLRETRSNSTLSLMWTMPLDRRVVTSASMRRQGDSHLATAQASGSPDGGQGWSWNVAQSAPATRTQGQLGYTGQRGTLTAGIDDASGKGGQSAGRSAYAGASGSMVWIDRALYATRRIDDAFALVSTDGVGGVPVRLENQLAGETDAYGHLLLQKLNAHQRNHVGIDVMDLPLDIVAGPSQTEAVPQRRTGMLLQFKLKPTFSVTAALRDVQGAFLAAGSAVQIDAPGAAATQVGYDGRVYFVDPSPGAALAVTGPQGQRCRAALPAAFSSTTGAQDLGVLTCR